MIPTFKKNNLWMSQINIVSKLINYNKNYKILVNKIMKISTRNRWNPSEFYKCLKSTKK